MAVARTSGGFTVTNNSVSPVAAINFPGCTAGTEAATYWSVGVASSGATKLLYSGAISPTIRNQHRRDVAADHREHGVPDAAMAVTLRDAAGAEVAGQVWPLAMTYVADTSGVYRATLLATLDLAVNARYVATITADGGPGLAAQWDVDVVCRRRRR